MLPVVTMLGMDLGYWLGNLLFIETVFGLPGAGRLLTQSLARRDLPVLMAITVFMSLLIVLLNLFIDVIYGVLDPRVRIGGDRDERRRPQAGKTRAAVSPAKQPA
jgi:ABC-type dipeptide/oligopeptide/nickel transport system permease component